MKRALLLMTLLAAGAARAETAPADKPTEQGEQGAAPAPAEATSAGGNGKRQPASDEPPPSTWDRQRQAAGDNMPEEHSWTGQLLRTLVGLAIVLALIYLVFKVGLARLLNYGGGRRLGGATKALRIVERLPLDPRHALFLVEVSGGARVLLGTGEQGVQLLAELDQSGRPHKTARAFTSAMDNSKAPPAAGQQEDPDDQRA